MATTPDVTELYDGAPMFERSGLTEDAQRVIAMIHGLSLQTLSASTRPDMAGAPISLLRPPITYQQKAIRMWEAYATDPLFKRLVDRVIDFSANSSRWEVQEEAAEAKPTRWLERITNWFSRREGKAARQEEIWNAWYDRINLEMPNTVQGGIEVTRWMGKHLLLGAMAVVTWEWQPFKVGKLVLTMPTRFTVYPESAVALMRPRGLAMQEEAYLYRPQLGMFNAHQPVEAQPIVSAGDQSYQLLPQIGSGPVRPGQTESFILKYNYSPGDLATARVGQHLMTTWGPYPTPPFIGLLPQFMLRQKLFAADLALADGVANYMKVYKIGNKEFPPREPERNAAGTITNDGTIGKIRKLIMEGMANPANAQFLPYWVDLEIKMPSAEILMSEEKYVASAIEIFQAFGIFGSRSQASRNERFEKANISAFEEMLYGLQMHYRMLWTRLAMRVIQVNGSVLLSEEESESEETRSRRIPIARVPTWTPGPLNTKSEAFMKQLVELAKLGRLSSQTLLVNHGLDTRTEQRRIAEDLAYGADEVFDKNIPLGLVQSTVNLEETSGEEPDPNAPAPPPTEKRTIQKQSVPVSGRRRR